MFKTATYMLNVTSSLASISSLMESTYLFLRHFPLSRLSVPPRRPPRRPRPRGPRAGMRLPAVRNSRRSEFSNFALAPRESRSTKLSRHGHGGETDMGKRRPLIGLQKNRARRMQIYSDVQMKHIENDGSSTTEFHEIQLALKSSQTI